MEPLVDGTAPATFVCTLCSTVSHSIDEMNAYRFFGCIGAF